MTTPAPLQSNQPLYWLALGAFAISTEGFMIAPLLPHLAADLSVSLMAAGQLVTAFALAYALSSPVLTALTGHLDRRILLIVALGCFAVANVIASTSTSYHALMMARILLAFTAGLYLPNANAVAGALVAPERRGRALAIVNGGSSVAIALGVPLGAIIGSAGGWRATFAWVAVLAAIGTIGLIFGLPKGFGKGLPAASLRERINVARRPAVLLALLTTLLWATGAYTVYTYVAVYIGATAGAFGPPLSAFLFVWGVSAVTGIFLGGRFADKLGPVPSLSLALTALTCAFVALWGIAASIPQSHAPVPLLVAVVAWGMAAWAFIAPQQARLMRVAGLNVAPVALSLNASFMYAGFSLGAALGAFTLSRGSHVDLGWVAALCELLSLAVLLAVSRKPSVLPSTAPTP